MKRLIKKWKQIIHLGVTSDMTLQRQRKVILSNQLAVVLFFVLIVFNTILFFYFSTVKIYSFLSIFTIWFAPFLNYKKRYNLVSVLMCSVTAFFILWFSTTSKISEENTVHLFSFIIPKILMLSLLVMPFILIDKKQKGLIIFNVLFILLCIFLLDPFHLFLNVDIFDVKLILDTYYLNNLFMIFPMAIILFALVFLTNINAKYEEKIMQYVKELQDKNSLLEEQKQTIQKAFDTIAEKNKNITQSINYVSRIQTALLPDKHFRTSFDYPYFIYFSPRDIVSGDFYWMKKINNKIILAVADCTGHGVPGAFVSMLGITFLNEIVGKETENAAQVLEKLRYQIKTSLNQTETENATKDGMDIAFCILDTETYLLQFAGAFNPLYIVRNRELLELKATRNPIGVHIKEIPFENNEIELQEKDKIYLFSDGYPDQFGGKKGRKYLYKRFKQLLLTISDKSFNEQKQILDDTIKKWKADYEQNDDILIVGFEV